ncbi:protein FAM81A-like isoform X2 [Ostrea edulis]|uniref:protein FAM81A-like isoform X2 n=1 Tax=Ostrea edulis TaxID=37623 RepID=UPI00209517A8|nr:protein FAM81A-like isoform X2 [Ostrea edulis]XP_048736255.1 protein FAM81A-like isoform X2 [Ostrea edulis]XP_056022561.1 protein FAM81A-like isoform X2 [Ostrea edulis]XP_056022562.1 protein FAM81A-like isoform X2 [Ostrea edulis]
MARRGQLPVLRPPYDIQDEPFQRPSPRNNEPETRIMPYSGNNTERQSRGPSRLDLLEERLAQQEKNSQNLVDRAFKIKEDVIDSLNFTHGTWQEEKHARNMLQEHIRTITAVVNRLNNDISQLEDSVRHRDNATLGTNNAVKNLEVHHVASLTDLRGRIVRCDTSISRLSTELHNATAAIKQMSQQQNDMQGKIIERIHEVEARLVSVQNNQERVASENKMKLQHLEGDTGQQMATLDSRTRSIIDDLKNSLALYQSNSDGEREKLEARLMSNLERISGAKDNLIERVERKIDESNFVTDNRIQKIEEAILEEKAKIADIEHHLENKITSRLEQMAVTQKEEFARLKRETREGFSTVHESITNMKTVMEGKRKLLEDQLRKEISQIRKMVVLV